MTIKWEQISRALVGGVQREVLVWQRRTCHEGSPMTVQPAAWEALSPWGPVRAAESHILHFARDALASHTEPARKSLLAAYAGIALRIFETDIDLGRPDLTEPELIWCLEGLPPLLDADSHTGLGLVFSLFESVAEGIHRFAPEAGTEVRDRISVILSTLRALASRCPALPSLTPIEPGTQCEGLPYWAPVAQAIVDTWAGVSFAVDDSLQILAVNQAWNGFADRNGGTSLTGQAIIGRRLTSMMVGTIGSHWQSVARAVLAGTLPSHREHIACHSPEEARILLLTATPIRLPSTPRTGPFPGLVFRSLEFSENQRELCLAHRLAQQWREVDKAFATARTYVHEINNALTVTLGYTQMLAEHPLAAEHPELRSMIDLAVQGATSATLSVRRLGQLARQRRAPGEPGRP